MDTRELFEQVTAAMKAAPQRIPELLRDPVGTVSEVTGIAPEDLDADTLRGLIEDKASELGIDLSKLDLANLDLSAIGNAAGGLFGKIGGLFGRK